VHCCKLLGSTSDEVGEAGGRDLNQIVARTGYASPYAFAAAFRRHHGDPPGRRRQFQKAPKSERRR
jgi:transcriptional regulator GlxA family with amidase domain